MSDQEMPMHMHKQIIYLHVNPITGMPFVNTCFTAFTMAANFCLDGNQALLVMHRKDE